MDLNQKDGKLYVNYGERLVTLLREVRQVSREKLVRCEGRGEKEDC